MNRHAIFSPSGKYRYVLIRTWDPTLESVAFIMLNPSTADEKKDDATIRRCIGFTKDWGFGKLVVLNLFAMVATKPKDLLNESNPIGNDNEAFIQSFTKDSKFIICAWGNSLIVKQLLKKCPNYKPFKNLKHPLFYLDLCNDGTPKHPLYLRKDLNPIPFHYSRVSLTKYGEL